jgi:phosphohistidine phosphatase
MESARNHSMEQRQLIVMRHATANPGDGRDHARTLTAQGQDEARRVGLALRAHGPIPDRTLCSSAIRCRETLQALSAGLGTTSAVDFEDSLYNASPESLLHGLAGVIDERRVLLLAHNPGVHMLALDLARGDEASITRLRAGFAPATIACFEISGQWSLLSSGSARLTRFERAPTD